METTVKIFKSDNVKEAVLNIDSLFSLFSNYRILFGF